VLDFTSALYLGMTHPSASLRPWARLTTGTPAALSTPAAALRVAGALAGLQGCAAATVTRSTLHAFWDLVPLWAGPGTALYIDAGAYPVSRWAAERAASRGTPVRTFPHLDASALRRRISGDAGRRPVVVADGVCGGCGRVTPVAAHLAAARRQGGLLVLDDTQALGLLGHDAGPAAPFGQGGGGSLRFCGVSSPHVVLVSSLAKALGVPMTVICGPASLIQRLEETGETRVYSSPPSLAELHAAEHALAGNLAGGDRLRRRLARLVEAFQAAIRDLGPRWLGLLNGIFPVQNIAVPAAAARQIHQELLRRGVLTVLLRETCQRGPAIGFVITVTHTRADVERAGHALRATLRAVR
jgi:8-amino-7-oxononanoate synthase